MRILFIGGLYRGYRLAERLLARGEHVVGAFVYEEDAHESPKYSDRIAALFSEENIWVKKTRKITGQRLSEIRDILAPDVVFCLGWRTLIPMEVLECAPLGGVAVHDSLLPRLRGFAPTNWGLVLGHDCLGATLFQLTHAMDAGDIYFQEAIAPESSESYESIQEKIAAVSVRLFDQFLDASRSGTSTGRKQDESKATYTCARAPADGEINWQDSSEHIDRLVRALGPPAPGAFSYFRGAHMTIAEAHRVENPRNYEGRIPGRIIDRDQISGTVDVLCGEGVLRIRRVKLEYGAEVPASSAIKTVRESLGLNYSQEIICLRTRLEQLESQIARLGVEPPVKRAG